MSQPVTVEPSTNGTGLQDEAWLDHLWQRRDGIVYRTRLSVLYHLKRAAFFDAFDKVVSAVTAVSATGAVVVVLQKNPAVEPWFAVLTACLSLVPLVYNPGQHARHHTELVGQFRRALADMTRAGEHWSAEQCDQFAATVLELEVAEPAPLGALVAECQNQLGLSLPPERRAPTIPLRRRHRWFKHWFAFNAAHLAGR